VNIFTFIILILAMTCFKIKEDLHAFFGKGGKSKDHSHWMLTEFQKN
jgi:hypothetical protein